MNTEILGVIAQIVLMVVLSYPLGKYIAKVYKGKKVWSDFMKPVESLIFRLSGINPEEEMNWKQFLRALLVVNAFWFVWGMVLLVTQGLLPLNPDGNIGQTAHQAFNTCISFMVNCNEQHYSGETNLTYFTTVCHHAVPIYNSSYRYRRYGWHHESAWRKNNPNEWHLLEIYCAELYPHSSSLIACRRFHSDYARNSYGI